MRLLPSFMTLAFVLAAGAAPLGAQVVTTLNVEVGTSISATSRLNGLGAPSNGVGSTLWTGTITVQLDDAFQPTTLTILSASLTLQNGGTYAPGPGGELVLAPGNYGFTYNNAFPYNAIREGQAGASSSPMALSSNGGNNYGFLADGLSVSFTAGGIDFRNPFMPQFGRNPLAYGPMANAAGLAGTFSYDGSGISLQLPVDFMRGVTGQGETTYRFFGTINATGAIPEPSTWALMATGLAAAAGVRAHRGRAPRAPEGAEAPCGPR